MQQLAVIVLRVMMLSAAFVGVASAQDLRTANLIAFSPSMNFMSEAGYIRYLDHQQTGQWTPFTP